MEVLPTAVTHMNMLPNAVGVSPHELVFGRTPILLGQQIQLEETSHTAPDAQQWFDDQKFIQENSKY